MKFMIKSLWINWVILGGKNMKEIKRTDKNMLPINENVTCPNCSSKLYFAFHVTMEDEEETNKYWKYHDWDIYKCEKM